MNLATVTITIRRPNGMDITATGHVDDMMVVDIAGTLGAMLFDQSIQPAASSEPSGA